MNRIFLFLLVVFGLVADPKVILFNDTSAWYHWGCTGTSTALKEGICALGYEVEAIPIQMTYSLKEVPSFDDFDDADRFTLFSLANASVVDRIRASDAVVITGEGTIHDLRDGPRALLYLAYSSKKFLGKHVEIINHSAYPKDDPQLSNSFLHNFGVETSDAEVELRYAESAYKKVYDVVDFTAIREPFSQKVMQDIGVDSTLSFDCLPLYIRDHYQGVKVEGKRLVLAGSVAFTETGLSEICRYMEWMNAQGYAVQVLIGAADFPAKDDVAFVNFLRANSSIPFEVVNAVSMDEWLDTIHNATIFVSGRFHHSIAAFCLGTPFIALNSNTHKVHAICSYLGGAEPLSFSDPSLLQKLVDRTDRASMELEELREIQLLAERNFDGLRAFRNQL